MYLASSVATTVTVMVGDTMLSAAASARLICGQLSIGSSLTGFSIPFQLLSSFWLRSSSLCKVGIWGGTGRSYGIRWRSDMRVTDERRVTDGRTDGRMERIAQV